MRSREKAIRYLDHALTRMQERGISKQHVEKAVRAPDQVREAKNKGARRFEKKISSRRRIAVIAGESDREFEVITAFWL